MASIVVPHRNDVLFGRGARIDNHHGNKQFRSLVDAQKLYAQTLKRREKRTVALEIMQDISSLEPPGRFLMESKGVAPSASGLTGSDNDGVDPHFLTLAWIPVDPEKVVAKVLHRLREKNSGGEDGIQSLAKQDGTERSTPPDENMSDADAVSQINNSGGGFGVGIQQMPGDILHSTVQLLPRRASENSNISSHKENGIDTTMREVMDESARSSTTIAITLKEWMMKAMQSDTGNGVHGSSYLHSAVDLGLALTKHLIDLQGDSDNYFKPAAITSNSLIIVMEPDPLMMSPFGHVQPQIKGVKFHSEDLLHHMPLLPRGNSDVEVMASSSTGVVNPREACTLLGELLLEIFSKGQFNSMTLPQQHGGLEYDGLNQRDSVEHHGITVPSVAKRMASVAISDSVSAQAKSLLDEMGAPLSILRLVSDLLDTVNEKPPPGSSSHITLDQALWDLTQMKNNPQMFLFDRTCPEKALDDAHLFDNADGQLFGREEEMNELRKAKNNVMRHCSVDGDGFLFEAAFLSGYAGSGKSYLLRSIINACEEDKWFVLKCKFDSKSTPLRILANAFDDFFGRWGKLGVRLPQLDQSILESFHGVCRALLSAVDDEAFSQLCGMIPTLSRIAPRGLGSGSIEEMSLEGAVGAAENRLVYLFRVLFKALCSAGRPVLVALDDLQWSDDIIMRCISDFVANNLDLETPGRQGLLTMGTYRSNEVKEGGSILETINFIKKSGKTKATVQNVDGLSAGDNAELISAKLGLPIRYTLELAKLVHRKTNGNPFFVLQFLRTIIQNKMLQFSVRQRKWTWDCDTIDLQMISDGVAELLTSTFDCLPANLLQALEIVSLFGNHIHILVIDRMNSTKQVLSFDIMPQLDLAVEEGLLEKAGPYYAFSHDLIHQTLYNCIPSAKRRLLHKTAGKSLLGSTDDGNHTMHLLAVDQINLFLNEGEVSELSHEERSEYARANVAAAEFSVAESSFDKARSYVDMGMQLLQPEHWDNQYSLSLELYEMSASLCYICGDTTKMSNCLQETLTHVKTFEDSLNAAAMLSRLLASSHKHNDAMTNCLDILSKLGEDFPPQPEPEVIQNILSETRPMLLSLTADQMKALPPMTDTNKLQAMKFSGMLCDISLMAAPTLLPLLSIRMMKLSHKYGFCIDTIVGIVTTAYSVFLFTDDAPLAYQVSKVGVCLREESPKKHLLRSRLCLLLEGNINIMIEPTQAVVAQCPPIIKSAMIVGDVQSAMLCRYTHCLVSFFAGENLRAVSNHFALCIKQSAKYQQHVTLNMAMAYYIVLLHLSGKNDDDVKSFNELYQIGEDSNNNLLLFHVIVGQLYMHFWFRDYAAIMKLCEKHPAPPAKRILTTMRCLFEGIAALNIARRQCNEPKYRKIGEKAVNDMAKFEQFNRWTFENKSLLLQAELHYLNQDFKAAEEAYLTSINSAKDHKFIHDEAMANELFGLFCIENKMDDKGTKHLCVALDLYKQWGAMNKAADLQKYIEQKV